MIGQRVALAPIVDQKIVAVGVQALAERLEVIAVHLQTHARAPGAA